MSRMRQAVATLLPPSFSVRTSFSSVIEASVAASKRTRTPWTGCERNSKVDPMLLTYGDVASDILLYETKDCGPEEF
jgi:hypothetical protein